MVMYDNGKILIFGVSKNAADSYVIDLNAATPVWRKVGSLNFARKKFSTVVLPDGRVLAIGGTKDGGTLDSSAVMTPEIWDPKTEVWSTLPDVAVPRMYHSNALLLPNGQVLSAGGGRAPGWTDQPSAQLYSPDYLSQPNRPAITGVSSQLWTAGGTASLNVSSANGVASVVLMGLPSVTHGMDTTARRLVLPITSNPGNGSVSVQVPSISSAPAGHYYLIALDSRGVPSAAQIVQVTGGAAATATAATTAAATEAAGAAVAKSVPRTAPDTETPEGD
jgi:galactose oxidase